MVIKHLHGLNKSEMTFDLDDACFLAAIRYFATRSGKPAKIHFDIVFASRAGMSAEASFKLFAKLL